MKLIKSASIVIIILLAIIISSCKKNDNTSPDSSGGNGTTQIANNAVFLSRKQAMITNTSVVSSGNFSTAFISTSALVNNGPIVGTLLTMGDVSLNGTTFQTNRSGGCSAISTTPPSAAYPARCATSTMPTAPQPASAGSTGDWRRRSRRSNRAAAP